ncbi:MAG TPA: hypothetical protein VHC01_15940 [Gaiellaceae bacterium]|nr:hypothetical protein [Gaiellaceae bacterium]
MRQKSFLAGGLILAGIATFTTTVLLGNVHAGNSAAFVRAGYCSVAGDTGDDGTPLQPGTFLDLTLGAPAVDGHYAGAVPANFVAGVGLTCSTPPSGDARRGFADGGGHPGAGIYPYYAPASSP